MDISNQITLPIPVVNDIQLTASIPLEMINAQQQLITWCDSKLASLKFESKELFDATEHAKKMKWKSTTLYNQYNRSLKKVSYYEKIKEALLEGYYIVPNFPIQMFAIRTKKESPEAGYTYSRWENHEQKPQELSLHKGEYQNPFPLQRQMDVKVGTEEKTRYWASGWDDFEFPTTMAKPVIMEATSRAMALKIFDQIGIMPAAKKEDPVIIGQIITRNSYITKTVSFMIAWHLNTNVL